jgi:hypothetical protein
VIRQQIRFDIGLMLAALRQVILDEVILRVQIVHRSPGLRDRKVLGQTHGLEVPHDFITESAKVSPREAIFHDHRGTAGQASSTIRFVGLWFVTGPAKHIEFRSTSAAT